MDLTTLSTVEKAEAGFKMEIVNPATGVPVGATITLAGIDSKIYQDAQHKISNKRMKRMNSRGGVKFALTSEEVEFESIELLARCTLGWENVDWEGSPLPFNFENAKMIYTVLLWLREQCVVAMEDRANFLQD